MQGIEHNASCRCSNSCNHYKNGGHKLWWRREGSGLVLRSEMSEQVRWYQGDQAALAWHNKTLKPQLKGNIWRKRLYVSQSHRTRVRDTRRKRWWINRGEKQAESSCEDLTISDGVCKTAWGAEQAHACVRVCAEQRGAQLRLWFQNSTTEREM